MNNAFLAFAFLGVVAGSFAIFRSVNLRMRVDRRMKLLTGESGRYRTYFLGGSSRFRERGVLLLETLGRWIPLGARNRQKIDAAVRAAGARWDDPVPLVLGTKMVMLVVGVSAGLVVVGEVATSPVHWGFGAFGALLFGVVLNVVPEFVLSRIATLRRRRIVAGMGDGLDLLIICLESGMTFERALQRTAVDLATVQPEVAAEFRRTSLDMSAYGQTRTVALHDLASRLDSRELKDFATIVSQSERHGTPLADALRKLASSLRIEAATRLQARLAKLPVLLVLPTVALVLPGILVIVGGPAFVHLMDSLDQIGS